MASVNLPSTEKHQHLQKHMAYLDYNVPMAPGQEYITHFSLTSQKIANL